MAKKTTKKKTSTKVTKTTKSAKDSAAKKTTAVKKNSVVITKIGRTSSESVEKHTGKSWDQWISLLKKAGASFWTHKEIVHYLKTKQKLSMWWQQIVSNAFEVHTGMRKEGENVNGMYAMTLTRNIDIPADKVWKKFASEEGIRIWLNPMGDFSINLKAQFEIADGIYGELRTMVAGKRIRLKWINEEYPKPTFVQFYVYGFKPDKAMIVVSHNNIANAKIKLELRDFWTERITNFIHFLSA